MEGHLPGRFHETARGLRGPRGPQVLHDESYCGDGDIWYFQALACRDTEIRRGDRICQFRIAEKMPPVVFEEREALTDPDRGGLGSTGDR